MNQYSYMAFPMCFDRKVRSNRKQAINIHPYAIIMITSSYTGVDSKLMRGYSRKRPVCEARDIAIFLIRRYCGYYLKNIAESFSNRHHTTILASIERVADLIRTDHNFRRKLLTVDNKLMRNKQ